MIRITVLILTALVLSCGPAVMDSDDSRSDCEMLSDNLSECTYWAIDDEDAWIAMCENDAPPRDWQCMLDCWRGYEDCYGYSLCYNRDCQDNR